MPRSYVLALVLCVGCGEGEPAEEDGTTVPMDDTNAGTPGDDDDGETPDGGTGPTDLPTEPVDAASLAGNTYSVDLASGTMVEPPGIGGLIQTYLTQEILLGVVAADATTIQFRGAIADDSGDQDPCAASIEFPVADFSGNPAFQVGPESLLLDIQGVDITIDELVVTGAFGAGGAEIVGATVAGSVDTRPLVEFFDPDGGDSAICDMVGAVGVSCQPCADGTGDFCLEIYVTELTADLAAGVTVVELTQADVDANAGCN